MVSGYLVMKSIFISKSTLFFLGGEGGAQTHLFSIFCCLLEANLTHVLGPSRLKTSGLRVKLPLSHLPTT